MPNNFFQKKLFQRCWKIWRRMTIAICKLSLSPFSHVTANPMLTWCNVMSGSVLIINAWPLHTRCGMRSIGKTPRTLFRNASSQRTIHNNYSVFIVIKQHLQILSFRNILYFHCIKQLLLVREPQLQIEDQNRTFPCLISDIQFIFWNVDSSSKANNYTLFSGNIFSVYIQITVSYPSTGYFI